MLSQSDVLLQVQRVVRDRWPMRTGSMWMNDSPFCQHHARSVPVFSFDALESLWNPDQKSSDDAVAAGVPLPRALYELDCVDWVRVPISSDGCSRGIMQLACLVADSSLHVYSDSQRAPHVCLFRKRVSENTDCPNMDLDHKILADPTTLLAIARVAGASLLIDAGTSIHLAMVSHESPCAWLLRDTKTNTWAARVFTGDSLQAALNVVRTAAFWHALKSHPTNWKTCASVDLVSACQHAHIMLPQRANIDQIHQVIAETLCL